MHTHIIHYVLFQWCPNKSERGGPERVGVLIVGINMSTNNESKYLKSTQSTTNSQIFNSVWTLKKYIINIPSKLNQRFSCFWHPLSNIRTGFQLQVHLSCIMWHVTYDCWLQERQLQTIPTKALWKWTIHLSHEIMARCIVNTKICFMILYDIVLYHS